MERVHVTGIWLCCADQARCEQREQQKLKTATEKTAPRGALERALGARQDGQDTEGDKQERQGEEGEEEEEEEEEEE